MKDESSLGLICRKGFNPDFSSRFHLHHILFSPISNLYLKISIYPTFKILDSKFSPSGPVLRFLRLAYLVFFLLLLLSCPPSLHPPLHFLDPPSSLEKAWSKWLPLGFEENLIPALRDQGTASNFILKLILMMMAMVVLASKWWRYQHSRKSCNFSKILCSSCSNVVFDQIT